MRLKLLFSVLSISIIWVIGCDDDNENSKPDPPGWLGSVIMSIETDTLWYLPGDSAETTITVIVLDGDGNVMEGQNIGLSLSNPNLGYIEFLDEELRDTTNSQGRVELRYTAVGYPGEVIFTATAGNIGTRDTLICQSLQTILIDSVSISLGTDTLWIQQGLTASTSITISVYNREGNPMEGQAVDISLDNLPLGYLQYLDPALRDTTNSEGQVELLFTLYGLPGTAIFTAAVDTISDQDTLVCLIVPTIIEVTAGQILDFWDGEGWAHRMYFDVLYTSLDGTPLAGTQLDAIPNQGYLVMELPLTNNYGRSYGTIISQDSGEICVAVTDGRAVGSDCGWIGQ